MKLSTLSGGAGKRKRKRLGRGEASGLGKTSGKGHKGQKARAGGKVAVGFEGGQMPLYRRLPDLGFRSRKKILGINQFNTVNLYVLERFEDGSTVDPEALKAIGYGTNSRRKAGIKILSVGDLSKKIHVKVHAISKVAREKIEAAGGSVELLSA